MDETTQAKDRSFSRWWKEFCGAVPLQYKRDFDDKKIETNQFRLLTLSLFIIAIQLFLNILNIVVPNTGGSGDDIMKYIIMSLVSLGVGVVYLVLSLLMRRGHFNNRTFRRILPFTLIYLYCIIQMIFLSFNVGSEAGMNSYIIALIVLGFFLIMRPIQSVLSILALFVAALVILATVGSGENALKTILLTDTWANLLIITSLIAVMSYVTYRMYLSNFLNSKQLEISNERLDKLAKTDELTGLYNRWGCFGHVDTIWTDYHEKPGYIAVFIFDLDYFKEYNDAYGHSAGDECLRQVARSMKNYFTSENDSIVCRYGGEEFLVITHTASKDEVIDRAERMRGNVIEESRKLLDVPGYQGTTISGGLVTVRTGDDSATLDRLIDEADKALYKAKESGRNTLLVAE